MNISLNENVLTDLSVAYGRKLTMAEVLCCLAVKLGANPKVIMQDLINRKVILQDFTNEAIWYIHSDYIPLIKDAMVESEDIISSTNTLAELVTKLQELFPKERKPDANGVPKYAYRGNKTDVANRLQKFFKLYGKYSYDDVLECTKRYVESFKYDKTYMKILPYYIMKDGESQLATELENMDTDESKEVNNDLNYGDMLI